jgi:hypothetical protein
VVDVDVTLEGCRCQRCQIKCADSDWVAAQFAAIIEANWPAEPGIAPQRERKRPNTLAPVVRACSDFGGTQTRMSGESTRRLRRRADEPWQRERSPPEATRKFPHPGYGQGAHTDSADTDDRKVVM